MAEETVLVTTSHETASAVRKSISQNFERMWVCVFVEGDNYRIAVTNNWGSALPENEFDKVKKHIAKHVATYVQQPTRKNKKELLQ